MLCVAVIAFAAATLDSTTDPSASAGAGYTGPVDELGGDRTPAEESTGDSRNQRDSLFDLDFERGSPFQFCQPWLKQPLVQLLLLFGIVGVFSAGRWLDDAATGLAAVFVVGYPGFFLYLLFTTCRTDRGLLSLGDSGRPAQEGGGLFGGEATVAPPSFSTTALLVLVVATLVAVAALVLTGNHDQREEHEAGGDEDDPEPEPPADMRAVGAAAGRAADRIEETDAFENEVYRAWAAMTDHLAVDRPESSTPAEFAAAATAAGMDPADVARLTDVFEEVRYGGEEPTAERERAAVETLRRIEATYADADAEGSRGEAGVDDGEAGDR
ncbi:hypothetical protein C475_00085 [Halosimplex carlsbadense 2-9-1]|uniref:Protein-glutamine gamma-glutamyltransferase-like C-terminal domain-containing protein n=1 Tax=Halosimplex carlsbadense 2-9-1 TaxID=797114 RepID=M0D4Y7_9EURY|nr:hypothetical protein C475_00085 [Halosimplex carlsbadense 2-9-1]